MEMPAFLSHDGLVDIRLRDGVDMRPTLIRVLTDLYVQKAQHTDDEERRYTELALRLLDGVDTPTRTAVAARLARHSSPPLPVVQYLLNDLPEIAAPLRSHSVLRRDATTSGQRRIEPAVSEAELQPTEGTADADEAAQDGEIIHPTVAADLNEQFFSSSEHERRLILLNLHLVAPLPGGRITLARDPAVGQRLEAAALGHRREDLAKQLAQALRIPRDQARRVAGDSLGEPITVAVKALGIARDLVYRILMFANPAVGHSVERVHALAALYDEMTLSAAEGMVAIWQALNHNSRVAARKEALSHNTERTAARAMHKLRDAQAATALRERRQAS